MSSARTAMPRVSTLATAVVMALAAPIALGQQNPAAGGAAQPAARHRAMGSRRSSCSAAASSSSARRRPRAKARVGGADLLVRPMLRVAELLEAVPGMVAVQHSGSGKANQYFLRGFNSITAPTSRPSVDGVPLEPSLARPRPGLSRRQRPDARDRRAHRLPQGPVSRRRRRLLDGRCRRSSRRSSGSMRRSLAFEGGENGWVRLAAGGTKDLDDGATSDGHRSSTRRYDGPWELPEDLEHTSVWGKYRRPTDFGTLAVTVSGYDGNWQPDGADSRARDRHVVCEDAFCVLDPTARRRHEALDRRCADGRRRVARDPSTRSTTTGSCSRIRPTTSRSTSSTNAGRRAAATSARCSKPTRVDGDRRRRVPLRRHQQRRARRVRRRRVRREHQPEQHPGDLARRVHRGELVARPIVCACWPVCAATPTTSTRRRKRRAASKAASATDRVRRRSSAWPTRSPTTSSSTATGARVSTRTTRAVSSIPTTRSPGSVARRRVREPARGSRSAR